MTSENRMPQSYLHQTQTRTPKQIDLSNKLVRVLSQINLKRVRQKAQEGMDNSNKYQNGTSKYFFVCLCGIPPFENQYENLDLPGEKVVIFLSGLLGEYTEQQYIQMFKKGGFENEAQKTRKVILEKSQKFKIIVVYHSFGTFTLMNYLRIYPDHKISGLIDIGGATIQFYPLLYSLISNFQYANKDFLMENAEILHQAYITDPKLKEAGFNMFKNKYQTMIFYTLAISPSFQTMFEYMRNLPKVPKIFLYGSKDRIFPEHLVNQKAVYYSYINKLEPQLEQKLKASYTKYYGQTCKNFQQRFIFNIQGGQHSLHMQNKYNADLKIAIRQFMQVIQGAEQS